MIPGTSDESAAAALVLLGVGAGEVCNMKWVRRGFFWAAVACCTWGCAAGADLGDGFEQEEDEQASVPMAKQTEAATTDSFIHVGGICSQRFVQPGGGKKSEGALGSWPQVDSVNAAVDQRDSMAVAVADLRQLLDERCDGQRWCYLYGYSNGAAVISKLLSIYDAERWNIVWVAISAGNEGGSELSASLGADLSQLLGLSCPLANEIAPSDLRPAWNHNDTAGNTFYQLGGRNQWWYTGGAIDFFDGMANDGAVAYHSSGGLREAYFVSDDDPWLCYEANAHYDQHEVAYNCQGYDLDHYEMKMQGIFELGG